MHIISFYAYTYFIVSVRPEADNALVLFKDKIMIMGLIFKYIINNDNI